MWPAIPSILWVLLAAIVLYRLRSLIVELIVQLIARIRGGSALKIFNFEVGAVRVEQNKAAAAPLVGSWSGGSESVAPNPAITTPVDPVALNFAVERETYYRNSRRIMLVHTLFRSKRPKQLYDVLIYLVPHPDGSLIEVTGVKYFFGRYWANQVFESLDRSRGYSVVTSAYGSFLCQARVSFNDGSSYDLYRYIDFEMGAYAPEWGPEDSA